MSRRVSWVTSKPTPFSNNSNPNYYPAISFSSSSLWRMGIYSINSLHPHNLSCSNHSPGIRRLSSSFFT